MHSFWYGNPVIILQFVFVIFFLNLGTTWHNQTTSEYHHCLQRTKSFTVNNLYYKDNKSLFKPVVIVWSHSEKWSHTAGFELSSPPHSVTFHHWKVVRWGHQGAAVLMLSDRVAHQPLVKIETDIRVKILLSVQPSLWLLLYMEALSQRFS